MLLTQLTQHRKPACFDASQTVGLDEAFLPLWELEEVGEGWAWWRSHLWQRAVFAASVAALLWALSRVAPGTGAAPTHRWPCML